MPGGTFDSGAFDGSSNSVGTFDTQFFAPPVVVATLFFEVSGALGFGTGGVQDRFPATGVTFPYAAVQLPTYGTLGPPRTPNSSANLDFSQPANSQYIPLLIP